MTAAGRKKFIALLLVLVFLLSLFPAAMAADGEGGTGAPAEPAGTSESGDTGGDDDGTDPSGDENGTSGASAESAGSSENGGSGENGGTGGGGNGSGESGGSENGGNGGTEGGESGSGENGGSEGGESGSGESGGTEGGENGSGENGGSGENDGSETEPDDQDSGSTGNGLPYNLPGMPWGYTLSVSEREAKISLTDHNAKEFLKTQEYTEDVVLLLTDRRDYAETVAAAYNAELLSFDGFFAELKLRTITVPQAIAVAADLTNNMPAVEPDWIIELDPEPVTEGASVPKTYGSAGADDPLSWYDWVESLGLNDQYLQNPDDYFYQWMHDTVNSYEAWGITMGSPDIVVAVLDTGVNANHPDLGIVLPGYNALVTTSESTDAADDHGHGTHVAGIIAAQGFNVKGGIGIAPGVSILPVKVIRSNGRGSASALVRGINWAVNSGANIINMSLGNASYSRDVEAAIQNAYEHNVTVVAAMGNGKGNLGSNIRYYPAGYDHVIAVAATDRTNTRTKFSHYGSWCSLAAPGQGILSTTLTGTGYGLLSGTSQATPIVAGAAALYMSAYGIQTPDTMKALLRAATNKAVGSGIGTGVLDMEKLLNGNIPTPVFSTAADGESLSGNTVSLSSADRVYILPGTEDDNDRILYTLDGSAPAMLNGEIRHGQILAEGTPVYLNSYQIGDNLVIRARRINGQGKASGIVSLKVSIVDPVNEDQLQRIAVRITEAPREHLVAGMSFTLRAEAYSTVGTSVSPEVVWSVVSQTEGLGADINPKTGKLTTRAGAAGTVTVRAASKLHEESYAEVDVIVDTLPPVKTMTLNAGSLILFAGGSAEAGTALLTATCVTEEGQTLHPDEITLGWTSSNEKVARVDGNGNVTAVGKGSAVIKALAQDGSGKSASCSVTVRQLVTEIEISGRENIAPGAYAFLRATAYPTNANNRYVKWRIGECSHGLTVNINAAGMVAVGKGAPTGSWFEVIAEARDGSGVSETRTMWVMPKTSAVRVWTDDPDIFAIRDKNGNTTGAILYRLEIGNHELLLNARREYKDEYGMESSEDAILWSSSNSKVAEVDEYGWVTAVSVGKATVTAKANDGSGKKANFTIQVINPASSLSLSSKALMDSRYVAYGKSIGIRSALGDAYGKPTITDLNWSFTVWSEYGEDQNLTEYLAKNRLVTLSSKGLLTVKSGAKGYGIEFITVRAETKDNTGIYDEIDIFPVIAPKKVSLSEKTVYLDVSTSAKEKPVKNTTLIITSDGGCTDYAVTSNNPKVAGGYIDHQSGYTVLVIYSGTKVGATAIKVKACDGSGKYAAVVVRVRE